MGKTMTCKICQQKMDEVFNALVLGKYQVRYHHCPHCGFLQTEDPFWLDEAYKEPINAEDTGLLTRNMFFSNTTALLLFFLFDKDKKFLDYAGGFGVFTRLMRDIGFDFYWHDPFTTNLLARGFELNDAAEQVELLTTFESFEHFRDPVAELQKMLAYSSNILFSTCLTPSPVPPSDWWYYQFEHGQHISFYSKQSLLHLAQKHGLHFYSHNFLHLLTKKKLPDSVIRWMFRFQKIGFHHCVRWRMKSKTEDDFRTMQRSRKP
jgi:hypothetical protein